MVFIIICGIIVLVALILLITQISHRNLSIFNIKINEAEKEIETLLGQKLSLLSDLYKHFSEKEDTDFQFLCNLEDVDEDEFKLNTILNNAYKELKNFLEDKHNYIPSDDIKTKLNDLYQCEIECIAVKNYYNDQVIEYNKVISRIPNNIVAKFSHLAKKELYNDPEEVEFEILKKK